MRLRSGRGCAKYRTGSDRRERAGVFHERFCEELSASVASAIPRSKKILGCEEAVMGLTADDFAEFVRDESDSDDRQLGDALAEIAIDVDLDSVEAVRDLRERT